MTSLNDVIGLIWWDRSCYYLASHVNQVSLLALINCRGVFRIMSKILDGASCKKSDWFLTVNYFCKNSILRCLLGFWLRLQIRYIRAIGQKSIKQAEEQAKEKTNKKLIWHFCYRLDVGTCVRKNRLSRLICHVFKWINYKYFGEQMVCYL